MAGFDKELTAAAAAAREAGAAAMAYYGRVSAVAKADASPVTAADHASNGVILSALRRQFPGDALLSEESADSADREGAERVWVIDPLDGTREFLSGNGEFAVMIGLAVGGEAVLGAVYLPDWEVLYTAVAGAGAWVERGGARRRLKRRDVTGPLRLAASRSHPAPLVERVCAELEIADVVAYGSVGVKCARIVDGGRDVYVHPVGFLKEWDTCAPEVLVREAGGWVSDCRGERLRYNKADPRQPDGMLACAPGCAGRVLAVVKPLYLAELETAA